MVNPVPTPESHRAQILSAIGRASTPPVKDSPFGITLTKLMKLPDSLPPGSVIVVGNSNTLARFGDSPSILTGMPGALTEQVSIPGVTTLIVDWAAFRSGPWSFANRDMRTTQAEEIFEAGRILRARGCHVWGIPDPSASGPLDSRIRSTLTADFGDLDPEMLEEKAPQSQLWQQALTLAETRIQPSE